jgi:sphingolipid 4-desaturase/C4-monooxygenase
VTANHLTKEFTEVDFGEPHRARRKAILARHPEVRALFGYDRRTALVVLGVVVAQLALAAGAQRVWEAYGAAGAVGVGLFALVIGAVLAHWCAMGIHECSHDLGARTPVGNRLVSLLANVPMVVPAAMSFHRYHIDHHTYLGVRTLDTDLAPRFEFTLVDNSAVRKFIVLLLFPVLYLFRGAMFAKRPDRWELLNLVFMVAVNAAIVATLGWAALAYLLASFWFGHGIHPVAAHFIHEHYIWTEGQETYSYYGPLNHVTFNVGLHYEHHDLMNIPGWRLPELRRAAPEFYEGLVEHRSWAAILWRYVVDPKIGPYTRQVRDEETFQRARREGAPDPRVRMPSTVVA